MAVSTFLGISGVAVPTVLLVLACHTINQAWYQLDPERSETVRALLFSQVALAALGVAFGYTLLVAAMRLLPASGVAAPEPVTGPADPRPTDAPANP